MKETAELTAAVIRRLMVDKRALRTLAGVWLAMASGSLTLAFFLEQRDKRTTDLSVQVQQVTVALKDVGRLEESLVALQGELKATQQERAKIEADYKRVTALKAVTEEQFLAIREAVTGRTTRQVIVENAVSFTLGVLSSLVASGIWYFFLRKSPP